MTSSYANSHRLFLQASMSERFFPETKAIEMYRKAYLANNVRRPTETFQEFMASINQKLNSIDMEFRKSHDETDGTPVWALVNTNGDEISKLVTEYTAVEISYFKHLIELIVTADYEEFSVSSITALREASKLKTTITKSAAESLLQKFVEDKWLILSKNGKYSLSQRAILELQVYLKETYEDNLIECTLCYDIITKGQRCDVQQCKSRFHHHCSRNYFASQTEKVCPSCKIAWKESNVIES
ncbi:6717_t:CDS:2 [Diversispora eburnea]|uniref:Non-structural maintenance of chromosomes element 1 homolog n=1 Tax=Diversispora eburnea TaxID=1213867 RepID=A0A9N8VJC3_9GLOM|nr:6717_t:CDS:2 [Diversispora eburnea]